MDDFTDVAVLMCVWAGDSADSFEAALLSVLNQDRNLVYMTVLSPGHNLPPDAYIIKKKL